MGSNDTREQQLPSSPCSWHWDGNKYINNRPPHSQLLQSTSSDLDNKMKMILELIENEGDTFAARAEMYYQKKPQLIKVLQEYHQSYCALADKYDHLKSDSSMKLALLSSPLSSVTKSSKTLISTHQDLTKENIDHQENSSSTTNMHSAEESIDDGSDQSHCSMFDQVQSPQNLITSIGSDNIIKSTNGEEKDMNLRKHDDLIRRNVEKGESMNEPGDGGSSSSTKSRGKRNQTRDHQRKIKLRGLLCLK